MEKVLQKGDISEAAEPYYREMDRKTLDKAKSAAKQFCQQLGQYRMPLAWTAINVVDIITGTKSAGQGEAVPIPPEKGVLLLNYCKNMIFLGCGAFTMKQNFLNCTNLSIMTL